MSGSRVVLITGVTGFIGQNLYHLMKETSPNLKLKFISSKKKSDPHTLSYQDFKLETNNADFFEDITDVVHLAAIAHQPDFDDEKVLKEINVQYPLELLEKLKKEKLQNFIFMSSIGVSLLEKDIILDTARYAQSKKDAEDAISSVANEYPESSLYMLRSPMVYGQGAPGNFARLIKLLKLPVILPFGSFHFSRPHIHIKNLCSIICYLIGKEERIHGWQVLEVEDPFQVSLSQFMRELKLKTRGIALILNFPISLVRFGLSLLGRKNVYKKLSLEFKVDNESKERNLKNWVPPVSRKDLFQDL